MKRPSAPPNPNHPSPSTSSSSSSCVLDDHPSSDQPLKQNNSRAKRARKRAVPQQRHQKEKQISSTTTNCDANPTNSNSSRRSSIYRGVTRHRWTGRFEAHLWDKSSYNSIQNKKGKQVYLGAYDCEDDAARTYDLAALKYWGPETILNFPSENYAKELEEMQNVSKEEYLASLRRCSSGFSRGVSKYRGVAKHHHNGRWEARIGRVFGNKYLYLGTFSSQEEAAKAYDLAAIQYRGRNAVTNFDINNYIPKDELQQDENAATFVETNEDVVVQPDEEHNEEEEQVQNQQPVVDAYEESELANAFNESPILVMDGPGCGPHEPNDDPWSFNLQDYGGGYDPLLVPHILQDEEEDGNLLDLLDPKAFEDDIHLIFDGYLEGMDTGGCQLMNEEKITVDKPSFDSSSPSSSSTVTIDLF